MQPSPTRGSPWLQRSTACAQRQGGHGEGGRAGQARLTADGPFGLKPAPWARVAFISCNFIESQHKCPLKPSRKGPAATRHWARLPAAAAMPQACVHARCATWNHTKQTHSTLAHLLTAQARASVTGGRLHRMASSTSGGRQCTLAGGGPSSSLPLLPSPSAPAPAS